jgi:hypothetical protein
VVSIAVLLLELFCGWCGVVQVQLSQQGKIC